MGEYPKKIHSKYIPDSGCLGPIAHEFYLENQVSISISIQYFGNGTRYRQKIMVILYKKYMVIHRYNDEGIGIPTDKLEYVGSRWEQASLSFGGTMIFKVQEKQLE